jgi:protein 1.7
MTNPIYDDKDGSRITCIDAIRAALTIEEYTGFLKGNIIKYIWREQCKGKCLDCSKALSYVKTLQLAIMNREGKKQT